MISLYFGFFGLLHILNDGTGQRGDKQAVLDGGELVVPVWKDLETSQSLESFCKLTKHIILQMSIAIQFIFINPFQRHYKLIWL